MSRLSDEAILFGRLAMFGFVVGGTYWFVTYETAGTVLLLGFGAASGVASVTLWARPPRRSIEARDFAGDSDGGPVEGEYERIPAPAFAPLLIGLGAGISGLGLALGPLILPMGVIVVIVGGRYWLEAVMREGDATTAADRE